MDWAKKYKQKDDQKRPAHSYVVVVNWVLLQICVAVLLDRCLFACIDCVRVHWSGCCSIISHGHMRSEHRKKFSVGRSLTSS